MIFDAEWKQERERERLTVGVLRSLSRLYVAEVFKTGDIRSGNPIQFSPETIAGLATCHLRGWAEPIEGGGPGWIYKSDPVGQLSKIDRQDRVGPDPKLPNNFPADWRLTDSGWNVIHRQRVIELIGIGIGILGIGLAIIALIVA